MGIYKIEHKRPEDSRFANNVNFLACILLASDWFKDNQLLSQLTHAHNRDSSFKLIMFAIWLFGNDAIFPESRPFIFV